jgi:hypothetical protein
MSVDTTNRGAAWLSIFTSASTLVCCALPAALVAFGAGATLVSLTSSFPQLIWLSEHKLEVFGLAGAMLIAAGVLQWRTRNAPCPIDEGLARACERQRNASAIIYGVAVAMCVVGAFFAFGAPLLL